MGLLTGSRADRRLRLAFAVALAGGVGVFGIGLFLALGRGPVAAPAAAPDAGRAAESDRDAGSRPGGNPGPVAGLPALDVVVVRLEEKLAAGGSAEQWLLLGRTYAELGRRDEARRALERARAADPRLPGLAEALRQVQDPAFAAPAIGGR